MESAETTTLCFRCHYDLRVTPDDQPCPECGLLAGRSRRATDALRDARPKWLRSLSVGVWLILAAMVLAVVAGWLGFVLYDYLYRLFPPPQPMWWGSFRLSLRTIPSPPLTPPVSFDIRQWRPAIVRVGWDVAALVLAAGAWVMTRAEGYASADRLDRKRRIGIRIASLLPLVAMLAASVMGYTEFQIYRPDDVFFHWDMLEVFLVTLGCAPLPALGFVQLKSLAHRAGSRHLSEHCSIVGWGTSGTLVVIFAVYLLNQAMAAYSDKNWSTRSNLALIFLTVILTSSCLFILWSFYLMIRFAISFGRASRQSRIAWQAADRAQTKA